MRLRRTPLAAMLAPLAFAARVLAAWMLAVWVSGVQAASSTETDARAELTRLYSLSVVLDTCAGLDVSDDAESRLDKAISTAEGRLALTLEASEALYTAILAAADSDKETFCVSHAPTIRSTLEQLPE